MTQPTQALDLNMDQLEFNMQKGKLYINDAITHTALKLEIGTLEELLRAPFGLSNKFNPEATSTTLEAEPSEDLEAVLHRLVERVVQEVGGRSQDVFGEILTRAAIVEKLNSPLHSNGRGALLKLKIGGKCPVLQPGEESQGVVKVEQIELAGTRKGCSVAAQVRLSPVWVMHRRGTVDQWGFGLYTDALFVKNSPTGPGKATSFGSVRLVY